MHLDKKRAPLLLHWDKKRAPLISSEQLKAWKQLTNSHTANCCSPLFRETFAADSGTRGVEEGGGEYSRTFFNHPLGMPLQTGYVTNKHYVQ